MAWKGFIISLLAVGVAAAHNATEAQTARILAEFQMPEMLKDLIKMEVAKDCENANAVDKTEDASNAVIQFCDCAFRLFAEDTFSIDKLATAIQNEKVAQFWKTNCDKSVLLRKCLAGFIAGYSPCAQKDLMKSIAVLNKDLESVLDFACLNDGERLTELTTKETIMCFYKKQDSLRECYEKLQNASTSNYEYLNRNTVRSMSSEQVCTKVNEASTCVTDAVQGCETSAEISAFLEDFTEYFQKTSGSCQDVQEHE